MDLTGIEQLASARALTVLGGFTCQDDPTLPLGTRSLILLGPAEHGYWDHIQASDEWRDGMDDPIDRWSSRVIGEMAAQLGATALFPFGGAPYHPFYQWALRSGRIWESPVRLLVHASHGLMVSFRGALALREVVEVDQAARPCDLCSAPCLTACPVGALGAGGYDVAACHGFLDTSAGADCMNSGCAARRACPLPAGRARLAEHSAYHMGIFHK